MKSLSCLVLLTLLFYGCKKQIDEGNSRFCIGASCSSSETITLIANGKDMVKFSFETDIRQYKDYTADFSISNGKLLKQGDLNAGDTSRNMKLTLVNGKAEGYIQTSTQPQDVVSFTCKIGNQYLERKLKFVKSYPDSISIFPEAYFNNKTEPVTVTAKFLGLETNYISPDIPVYFNVSSSLPGMLLQYESNCKTYIQENNTWAKTEIVNLNQDTGTVVISVSAINQAGAVITKSTSFKFQ